MSNAVPVNTVEPFVDYSRDGLLLQPSDPISVTSLHRRLSSYM